MKSINQCHYDFWLSIKLTQIKIKYMEFFVKIVNSSQTLFIRLLFLIVNNGNILTDGKGETKYLQNKMDSI